MKKSRHSPPKNGYWTPKMPIEDQFAHKNSKEDIVLARFHKKKTESQNHSLQIISNMIFKKTVFLGFEGVFWVKYLLFDG